MFNRGLNLISLIQFDCFTLYEPKFRTKSTSHMPDRWPIELYNDNLKPNEPSIQDFLSFGKQFSNPKLETEFYLSINSFSSIKLLNKNYKSIQKDFKWENISRKLSIITGLNGVGKTTLLKLINNSLNQEENKELSEFCSVKYFNPLNNDLSFNSDELNIFDKKLNHYIKGLLSSDEYDFDYFLYDNINYFSPIQYFDYLVSINKLNELAAIKLNKNFFKYCFAPELILERNKQQVKFHERLKKRFHKQEQHYHYYDELKSIEFYLGLNEGHKLSSAENLILLMELWRIHAEQLKINNHRRTKLRVFLLDNPDSHMHPNLIKEFVSLLTNNDLDYLNFQIIMSTHNPASVFLMPIESIFEMKRNEKTGHTMLNKAENEIKSDLLRDISNDFDTPTINVSTHDNLMKFKTVLTEGDCGDDKAFYSFINSLVNKKNYIPIKFQEMGNRMFNRIFLKNGSIFGINDGDYKIPNAYEYFGLKDKYLELKSELDSFHSNLNRIERYSFENYVYDPINFCFAIKYLVESKLIQFKNESKEIFSANTFFNEIQAYQNIDDFLQRTNKENAILLLNKLLEDTNDFYMKKLDKKHTFFEIYDLKTCSNDQLKSKLSKAIEITFILRDNSTLCLNYFPILLFFPGKLLKDLLYEGLNITGSAGSKKLAPVVKIFQENSGFLCDKSLYDILINLNKNKN